MADDIQTLATPAVASVDVAQLQAVEAFMEQVRAGAVPLARIESARLSPYFEALAARLARDSAAATGPLPPPGAEDLAELFNVMARSSGNTILSEILVAPEAIIGDRNLTQDVKQFHYKTLYNKHAYTFGFMQVFDDKKDTSVSVPVFAFDTELMQRIAAHAPEAMLAGFQQAMTAGNHDTLHHYSNLVLNQNISDSKKDANHHLRLWINDLTGGAKGDSDLHSYESWLMMNHARVWRILEEGPEGDTLRAACDTFFDELTRIGRDIAADDVEMAHQVVDYFGTMLGFALMRFLPLDHPLMAHAIERLQHADPMPEATCEDAGPLLVYMENSHYPRETVRNYAAAGLDLMPPDVDYAAAKRIQIIMMAPWMAHLLSPARPGTELAAVQERVGDLNLGMIDAAADDTDFLPDGEYTTRRLNGVTINKHIKNHGLSCEKAPALLITSSMNQSRKEAWYLDGQRHRAGGAPAYIVHSNNGTLVLEECYRQDLLHSVNDKPARREYSSFLGHRELEEWYLDGQLHREGGLPASVRYNAQGDITKQEWYTHGALNSEEGRPSFVECRTDGSIRTEKWHKDGALHRDDDKPAVVEYNSEGCVIREEWRKEGACHRDGGKPAMIRYDNQGRVIEESFYENGKAMNGAGQKSIASALNILRPGQK